MGSYIERIRERAPLRLNIDVDSPDGRHARWCWDDPNPSNQPMGLSFSSVMPGGFERFTCSLERDPRLSYPDLSELSTITVSGAGGQTAWQGRLEKTPDTGGYQEQVSPEAVGWQAHLEDDNSAREIYVDQELSRWEASPLHRKIYVLGVAVDSEDASVGSGTPPAGPGLVTQLTGAWSRERLSEGWYDAHGIPIGLLYGAWTQGLTYTDEKWVWDLKLFTTSLAVGADGTANLRAAGPATTELTATASDRVYAVAQLLYPSAAGGEGTQYAVYWTALAVYGRHGLTLYGTNSQTEAKGVLASDAVAHALSRWAPKLAFTTGSEGTIQPSNFVIPQLAFLEPTTDAEILKQATRFELQDWAVWEGPTFYMNPRGERGKQWRARVGPAQLQQAGPQVARLWNGVVVSYSDVTGQTRTVGPVGSGMDVESSLLEDTNPENPLNETGIKRWAPLRMGTSTAGGAERVGAIFLQESKTLETSGQASLVGHVEDESGVAWPAWMVRAGDTVSFVDASDASPRRIVHASYDDPTRTCQVQLDQPPDSLTAILERLSVSLTGTGLS